MAGSVASVMDVQSARATIEAFLNENNVDDVRTAAHEALAFLCSALEEARDGRKSDYRMRKHMRDKLEAAEAALEEARCAHESFGCGCWSRGFEKGQQTIDHDECVVRESHYITERDRLRAVLEIYAKGENKGPLEARRALSNPTATTEAPGWLLCACGHARYHHHPACGWMERCECARFVASNPTATTEEP